MKAVFSIFFILIQTFVFSQLATVYWYQKISSLDGNFQGALDNYDRFAQAGSIGDVNGDGVPDMAVGAPYDDDGGADRGAVWVLFLNPNGTVLSHQKISDTQGSFTGVIDNYDYFGWSVQSIGDFDNNGVPDICVGAYGDDDGGASRGALWLLFLNSNGTVSSWKKISSTQGNFYGVLNDADFFGIQSCNIGDLNGDGVTDIAVGASRDDDGGADRGAVWILFMNSNGTVNSYQKISSTSGGFNGNSLNDDARFGRAIGLIGDLDDDGVQDIIVGANGSNIGGVNNGAAWIIFLNSNGTVKAQSLIADPSASYLNPNSQFGLALTGVNGDINGDGIEDVIVTAHGDNGNGTSRGAIWVIYLTTSGTILGGQKIGENNGNFYAQLDNVDCFGSDVGFLGDIDNDGKLEICVGSAYDDDGGTDRGCAWVISLCDNDDCRPLYLNENKKFSVNVFPNPVHNTLYIENINGEKSEIALLNCTGSTLLKVITNYENEKLDISAYDNGLYFLRVLTEKNIHTFKIIINKDEQ